MEYKDREKIDYMCKHLLPSIDIEKLWPKLLEHDIYLDGDVNIPNWTKNLSSPETVIDICSTIKTRGPYAYRNLILSLNETEHSDIAIALENFGSTNKVSSCNNAGINSVENNFGQLNVSDELAESFDDEYFKDDYYKKVHKYTERLEIKVKKAEQFKDGPDFTDFERYPMRSNPRGIVLIITNMEYSVVDSRPSAQHDEANLKKLFEEMGFKVIPHSNLKGHEIKKTVKEFSKMKELRRVDSAFIIVSSHGTGEHGRQETEIQGVDYKLPGYETVSCTNIIDYFTTKECPDLMLKPKIFIFQTCRCSFNSNKSVQTCSFTVQNNNKSNNISTPCSNDIRGDNHQKAVSRTVTDIVDNNFEDSDKPHELTIRNIENTLIAYATLPGYVSYRDSYNGSWYIQILCEVFMNYACERHVQDLFNMIDGRLKDTRTTYDSCQTSWVVNQGFNKHCYLNPGLFPTK